jgi:uncharacterized membrane protein
MVQAVWSTAHGRPLEVTNLQGDQVSRLASHVDPLLAIFAPLWIVWPSPSLLLVAQAVAVALGAVPVYWLARRHLDSRLAASAFGVAYLLYPPVQWLTVDDFHPVALACPLLLFAFSYLDEDRIGPFAGFAVAAALAKEEIGFVVAAMGVWYALSRRRAWTGGVTAALGTAWSIIAIAVVIPAAGDDGADFYGRYEEVGGSPLGIVEETVTDPLHILSVALDERGVEYLVDLVLPLAGLPLLAPALLIVAVPELAINLLSSTPTQTSIHFHYTAGVVPGLFAASVFAAGRISRRNHALAAPIGLGLCVLGLVASVLQGPMPDRLGDYELSKHDRLAEQALDLVPAESPVSATNSLGAHLSERHRVFSYPLVREAEWIAIDERRPSLGDRLDPPGAVARIAALRGDASWRIVFDRDGILVLQRRR